MTNVIEIKKPNSQTFAKIEKDGEGRFTVAVMQGQGFEQVFFGSETFKTEGGARRWITRRFGF